MRRTNFRRIAIALGVGVMITVLMAWGLDRAQPTRVRSKTALPPVWPIDVPADWPMNPHGGEQIHWVGMDVRFTMAVFMQGLESESGDISVKNCCLTERRSGWPCRALALWDGWTDSSLSIVNLELGLMRTGVAWPKRWPTAKIGEDDRLPIFPLWPGFAINTLFYGGLAWATMAGVSYLKHRRRAKPGMCVACGYPVSGLNVCPECGTPVGSVTAM